jgi:hypothetical protein
MAIVHADVCTCVSVYGAAVNRSPVSQVYQLWAADYSHGSRAAVSWAVGLCVLVLPMVCLAIAGVVAATRTEGTVSPSAMAPPSSTAGSKGLLPTMGGALVAPYRPGCLWFGAALLLDRLVYAVVIVVASRWPVLQLVLVRGLFVYMEGRGAPVF